MAVLGLFLFLHMGTTHLTKCVVRKRYLLIMLARMWFVITMCLLAGYSVAAEPSACETEKIVAKIHHLLNGIRSYDVKISSSYENVKSTSFVSGAMPNKLYLKQLLYTPQGKVNTTTVFDGKYQWVDIVSPDARQIYKIKLNKVTKPDRPFDTSFNIYGTGLLSGEGYPGTLNNLISFYDLEASCSKDGVLLSGAINKDKFKKYTELKRNANPDSINKFVELFGFITFVIDTDTNMISRYSMGPTRSKTDLVASFYVKSINEKLDKSLFSFIVPKGLDAVDITSDLLSM